MSLKAFHIVFITASVALSFLVGGWAMVQYRADGGAGMLALSLLYYVIGAGLVVYGLRFLRKLKALGI